jgi:hypothetical protein
MKKAVLCTAFLTEIYFAFISNDWQQVASLVFASQLQAPTSITFFVQ